MESIAKMTVFDVQLGLAVHVKSPNGKYIIIDLGTGTYSSGNESPISKCRNDNIAYMIITHPHLDHISDILNMKNMPNIFCRPKSITNEEVMNNVRDCDRAKFERYCFLNSLYNIPINYDNENSIENPDNYGGLKIKTFTPQISDHSNFNNLSILTVFELSGIKVVVCGDNEIKSLEMLMEKDCFKNAVENADVLVAPHHGRESAYHGDFVSLVNPRITIISDTKKSEASAADKYSNMSRGWNVNGTKRKCLTTRNDGNIEVCFGEIDDTSNRRILYITTSN